MPKSKAVTQSNLIASFSLWFVLKFHSDPNYKLNSWLENNAGWIFKKLCPRNVTKSQICGTTGQHHICKTEVVELGDNSQKICVCIAFEWTHLIPKQLLSFLFSLIFLQKHPSLWFLCIGSAVTEKYIGVGRNGWMGLSTNIHTFPCIFQQGLLDFWI